ncbi:MAG: hypothetical protein KIT27_05445 [Legionellales bacterium]|nr:hypothetical protein [Legionellales bacterium]
MKYDPSICSSEVVNYLDIRDQLLQISPNMTQILDDLPLTDHHVFIKARYPFGEPIIKNGLFHIANSSANVLSFDRQNENLQNLLKGPWASIPLGICLAGSAESYHEVPGNIYPLKLLTPGSTTAKRTIFEETDLFNFHQSFNMTSGPRSYLCLASLGNNNRRKYIEKKYLVKLKSTDNFMDQFYFFKQLHDSNSIEVKWHCEFLFFSQAWYKSMHDRQFNPFFSYLKQQWQRASVFFRNIKPFDTTFNRFILMALNKGIDVSHNIFELAKNIIIASLGQDVGFSPLIHDTPLAPNKLIQNILIQDYRTKHYPTMMRTKKLDLTRNDIIYLSTQIPLSTVSPFRRSTNSIKDDMRALKDVLELFFEAIVNQQLLVQGTLLETLPARIQYYFITSEEMKIYGLKSSNFAFTKDLRLMEYPHNSTNLLPAESSPFFNGCVMIEHIA